MINPNYTDTGNELVFTEDPIYTSPEKITNTYPTATEAAKIIASNIPKYTSLSSLLWMLTAFGESKDEIDRNFQEICNALKKNTHIKEIKFYCANLSGKHSEMLSEVLLNNSTIKSIEISCCNDNGATAFANALQSNKSLTQLICTMPSRVSDTGCQALIEIMETSNHTLTSVAFVPFYPENMPTNCDILKNLLLRNKKANDKLLGAAFSGDLDKIKEALTEGADINAEEKTRSCTAIQLATLCKHKHIVEYLLNLKDSNINLLHKTTDGKTVLQLALVEKNIEIAKTISGLSANQLLLNSAATGSLEGIVKALKDRADVHAIQENGYNALQLGILCQQNMTIINPILQAGIHLDYTSNMQGNSGKSALEIAKEMKRNDVVDAISTTKVLTPKLKM